MKDLGSKFWRRAWVSPIFGALPKEGNLGIAWTKGGLKRRTKKKDVSRAKLANSAQLGVPSRSPCVTIVGLECTATKLGKSVRQPGASSVVPGPQTR